MDVVLTEQGRRALSNNKLKLAFYSLSDGSTFYQSDLISGSSDVTSRVYSECATDLPQDVISLQVNDARQVINVRSTALTSSIAVYGGTLLSGSVNSVQLTGSVYTNTVGLVLSSSIENLNNNFLLGTIDEFFEDQEFLVAPKKAEFRLSVPDDGTSNGSTQTANISTMDNFFQDPLLSHIPNFMYLPPINKPTDSHEKPELLGNYAALGGNIQYSFDNVKVEMALAKKQGRLKTFRFDPAPRENNIHLQIFEQSPSGLNKLDVVDYGTCRGESGNPVRVIFAGKVYYDDYGVETFVRLFTITLE
jgi:hypothetical protein